MGTLELLPTGYWKGSQELGFPAAFPATFNIPGCATGLGMWGVHQRAYLHVCCCGYSVYVCERDPVFYASSEMDPEMPWLERSPNFPAESSCMLILHITRWNDVWVPCRDLTESPRPPLHHKKWPNMPLPTRKPRGVHCFKYWRCLTIF